MLWHVNVTIFATEMHFGIIDFYMFLSTDNKEAYDYMDFALFKMHRVS
jgi:hypothetical protein